MEMRGKSLAGIWCGVVSASPLLSTFALLLLSVQQVASSAPCTALPIVMLSSGLDF